MLIPAAVALGGVCTYLGARSQSRAEAEQQPIPLSREQEIALGLEAAPEIVARHGGELPDADLQRYVQQVGQRVVQKSAAARSGYQFAFHVLADSQTMDAFALPGGQVFVTLGLLRRLGSEAELAGLLGHVIGHVMGRHGAQHLVKEGLTGDPDLRVKAVRQLVKLSYGRADELESDALGMQLMIDAGYDPRGMVHLMRVVESSGGSGAPEFFSTHPNPENRLARLRKLAAEARNPGEMGEERFGQRVLSRLPALGM
jgi:beta-barrel assembly-enhancing protease